MSPEELLERVAEHKDAGESSPVWARDPVNLPMIRNWAEAIGDENPIYVNADAARAAGHDGPVAPPAMFQVWTMYGLNVPPAPDDPLNRAIDLFDEAGYTAVVATNCEQTYHRYVRHGESLTMTTSLEDVIGPKETALGIGYFMTTRHTWRVGEEPVAEMRFRMLKYVAGAPRTLARSTAAGTPTAVGEPLPAMLIDATPTFVIASAIATRDFQDVHHDRDRAIAHGSKDIFVNIITDTGLVQRFVTDWSGPSAYLHSLSLRLLVPCYAYDRLVFTGSATALDDGHEAVSVAGRGQLGDHVVGTVTISNR